MIVRRCPFQPCEQGFFYSPDTIFFLRSSRTRYPIHTSERFPVRTSLTKFWSLGPSPRPAFPAPRVLTEFVYRFSVFPWHSPPSGLPKNRFVPGVFLSPPPPPSSRPPPVTYINSLTVLDSFPPLHPFPKALPTSL